VHACLNCMHACTSHIDFGMCMYASQYSQQLVRGMDGGRGHLFKIVGISHTGNSDGSWGSARQAWMWGCVRDHGVKSLLSVETRTIRLLHMHDCRTQQGAEHTHVSKCQARHGIQGCSLGTAVARMDVHTTRPSRPDGLAGRDNQGSCNLRLNSWLLD
jgi:hypothetical protein